MDKYVELSFLYQLAETLKREVPEVHVTAVDIEKIGLCIRFAPLETSYSMLLMCFPNVLGHER